MPLANQRRLSVPSRSKVPPAMTKCPICERSIRHEWINQHLDEKHFSSEHAGAIITTQTSLNVFSSKTASNNKETFTANLSRFFCLVSDGNGNFQAGFSKRKPAASIQVSSFSFRLIHPSGTPCNDFHLILSSPMLSNEYSRAGFESMYQEIVPELGMGCFKSMPFLKSHLQKCVRRQLSNLSIKTCFEMLRHDFGTPTSTIVDGLLEVLRRLPIIMIEDCALIQEEFICLNWWMIHVGKIQSCLKKNLSFISGHKLLWQQMIAWLFGVVERLCKVSIRDLEFENAKALNVEDLFTSFEELESHDGSLIYALMLRADYGGMQGDRDMLLKSANVWHKRFLSNRDCSKRFFQETKSGDPQDNSNVKLASLKLSPDEVELAAIDFHISNICSDMLVIILKEDKEIFGRYYNVDVGDAESALSQLMWSCSSSVNNRSLFKDSEVSSKKRKSAARESDSLKSLWQKYEPVFSSHAKRHLQRFIKTQT